MTIMIRLAHGNRSDPLAKDYFSEDFDSSASMN